MSGSRLASLATILFSLLLLVGQVSAVEPYLDPERIALYLQTQQYLFDDRFDTADSTYRAWIQDNPGDPAAYLFRAGVVFAEMSDREENLNEPLFRQLLDTVEVLTARILDSCGNQTAAWMYLFRGHARAYRALWESKFGSSIAALKLGLSTIDEYEAGLRRDRTLYDLYLGIGSYHYWKSAKAGLLRWFWIFKDEKDKGIAELRLAADSSFLHRELARSALIWVWLDRKEYDSAVARAETFLSRYPEGRTFLWPVAQARLRQGRHAEAADVFERLRVFFESSPGNYYNLIECDYYLVQCYNWLEDRPHLRETVNRFREYRDRIPRATQKRQSAKINYLKKIADRQK